MAQQDHLLRNANKNASEAHATAEKAMAEVRGILDRVGTHEVAINGVHLGLRQFEQLFGQMSQRMISMELRLVELLEAAGLPLDDFQRQLKEAQAQANEAMAMAQAASETGEAEGSPESPDEAATTPESARPVLALVKPGDDPADLPGGGSPDLGHAPVR